MKYYNLRFRPILYFRFDKYKSPKMSMKYAHAYDSMNARSRQPRQSCMQTKQFTTFNKSLISFYLFQGRMARNVHSPS
jgi:hypothetical protein